MKEAPARALEEEHSQLCRATRSSLRASRERYDPRARPALDGCSFTGSRAPSAALLLWVKMVRQSLRCSP